MLEDREHCVAEGNGCNLQQQEKQQQQHPSREQLPHSLKTTTDLPLPSQLNSSSESSSTPMSCNVLPTAVPEPVAWPQLSQQTSMSQLPLQAELTGQRTMSGLLSDSSTFLHPGEALKKGDGYGCGKHVHLRRSAVPCLDEAIFVERDVCMFVQSKMPPNPTYPSRSEGGWPQDINSRLGKSTWAAKLLPT
eukprot:1157803-Pelagomonas_calceolata.AAC.1